MKKITTILFVICLSPFVIFLVYDALYFQPKIDGINNLISSATEEEKNLPITVSTLLKIEFNGKQFGYASRLIAYKLKLSEKPQQNVYRYFNETLWASLIRLHLSEQEQNIIIAAYSPVGNDCVGFSAAAKARFNKNLASLSQQESATIVALTRAPSFYSVSVDHLNQRRDFLLNALSNYSSGEPSSQK